MDTLKNRLQQSIASLEEVSDLFYKQNDKEAYKAFTNSINILATTMEQLLLQNENGQTPENYQEILNVFTDAMNALEAKDTILLADILKYELLEKLQNILNELL